MEEPFFTLQLQPGANCKIKRPEFLNARLLAYLQTFFTQLLQANEMEI